MNELIREFRKLMIIFTVVVTIITYVSIYLPIRNELQARTLDNFVLASQEQEQIIEHFILDATESAHQFSEQNSLKDEVIQYYYGSISKEKVIQNLDVKYQKKAKEIRILQSAYRVVKGDVISEFNKPTIIEFSDESRRQVIWYDITISNNQISLFVYSPIMEKELYLGYDVLGFNLSRLLNSINRQGVQISIINKVEAERINNMKAENRKVHNMILKDDGVSTHYVHQVNSLERYYYIKIDNDILFQSIRKISLNNLIGFSISIILLVLITNWITIKMAQRVLLKTEESKAMYKEYATRDSLTGVYSRFFFDQWLNNKNKDRLKGKLKEKTKEESYIVVMIDIDDFKTINDTYGHNMGDKAVIQVANVLKTSLREDDYVIRYGGDEFLLLMKGLENKVVEFILQRIITRLENLNELDFSISISYGMQEVKDLNTIHKAIDQADEKMYVHKKNKKN